MPAFRALLLFAASLLWALPAAATTLQFWTMQLSPFHDDYVRGVIASFERTHPGVTIQWVDVPWAEMERKTLAALAARNAPDVVNLNPQFAAKLAEFGALADPERFLDAGTVASFFPAVWSANRLNGKTFALPWYLNTNLTLYNKDLLAQSGVQPPATLADLLSVARQVRQRSGQYAYFPALDASTPLEAMVAAGNPMLDARACGAGFTGPSGVAVVDSYRALYQEGLVPKNVVNEGHRKAVEMFLSGQVAMISTGMQFLGAIRNANPGLYGHIGVAPQIGAGETGASIAAMNVAVLESSAHKQAAFAFARHLTNAENQTALAKRVPVLPSTVASYQDPYFAADPDDPLLAAARKLSIAQVQHGRVLVPPVRRYSKLRVSFARHLQAAMLGRQSAPDAVAAIERDWRAILGCVQ